MEIDFLDSIKAERDEQKKQFGITLREAIKLGDLSGTDAEQFDQIEKEVGELNKECRAKAAELDTLRTTDKDEYVSQMADLCDYEAKAFSKLTGRLRALVQEIKLRRASRTLS